ncbi:MAG: NADPH:quinone oxidoreductase family protein [Ectothiorhodospiraceae bacterium]|nr:NADPH:quinone oxidoreductase family protein [Ectothiorhodospiraceae bacterium]
MKAVQADNLDALDAYRVVDLPTPAPGDGQVRIRVAYCSIGYVDALIALGRYQTKPALPHVPGSEVAGVIDSIGPGVTGLRPGMRVLASVQGGFAQYAAAEAKDVKVLPDGMTLPQAAVFRGNYLTAMHGLMDRGSLESGETVLVMGAAGGTGLAAVDVGRALGARVIAVASTEEKRTAAREAGAAAVLDREPDGWRERLRELAPHGIDVVYDPVCGPLMEPAFRSLKWRGRYLVIGFAHGDIPALRLNLPLLKGAALIGVDTRQFGQILEPDAADDMIDRLLSWVSAGKLRPPIGRRFGFDRHTEALAFALSGKAIGKSLLVIDETIG